MKRSASQNSNQSSSWSVNSAGSKESSGQGNVGDFKEKDFHKIHKAALNGDLEKLKEHLKKQTVDTTGGYCCIRMSRTKMESLFDVYYSTKKTSLLFSHDQTNTVAPRCTSPVVKVTKRLSGICSRTPSPTPIPKTKMKPLHSFTRFRSVTMACNVSSAALFQNGFA